VAAVPGAPASAKARALAGVWQVGWQDTQGVWQAADVDASSGKLLHAPTAVPLPPALYATDWRSVEVRRQAEEKLRAEAPEVNLFDSASESSTNYRPMPPEPAPLPSQTPLLISSALLFLGVAAWLYIRMKRG